MNIPKIGFLGGGQLGRMLLQECINYQVNISFLDPDPEAPCSFIGKDFYVGDYKDFDTVYNFGKKFDIVSIEIEHVNIDALEKLEKEGITIIPSPANLRIIQNKRLQKEFYKHHNIPSSEFVVCANKAEIQKHNHMFPVFQKLETEGYDGKGVYHIKDQNSIEYAFDKPSILEKKIPIAYEIAVIVAGDLKGNYTFFPPVEMVFDSKLNLLDYLICPAQISEELSEKCIYLALETAKAFNIKGLLAVELFIDQEGNVLVNEVAPRAHNSGHHTIEACYTSQFEQQLRILVGLPLGDTSIIKPGLMYNLIGAPEHQGPMKIIGLDKVNSDKTYLHLYGKSTTKPGRKMGHITLIDENIELLKSRIESIKEYVKIISN